MAILIKFSKHGIENERRNENNCCYVVDNVLIVGPSIHPSISNQSPLSHVLKKKKFLLYICQVFLAYFEKSRVNIDWPTWSMFRAPCLQRPFTGRAVPMHFQEPSTRASEIEKVTAWHLQNKIIGLNCFKTNRTLGSYIALIEWCHPIDPWFVFDFVRLFRVLRSWCSKCRLNILHSLTNNRFSMLITPSVPFIELISNEFTRCNCCASLRTRMPGLFLGPIHSRF